MARRARHNLVAEGLRWREWRIHDPMTLQMIQYPNVGSTRRVRAVRPLKRRSRKQEFLIATRRSNVPRIELPDRIAPGNAPGSYGSGRTSQLQAYLKSNRPGRAGAAPAGGVRGDGRSAGPGRRPARRSRRPPRTRRSLRAHNASGRLSTTRRRGGDVARRGEQRPGVDEKGTASVETSCLRVLLSSCPPVLMSSCPRVLVSSCPHILVSPCPRVLVEYSYIDSGNGPGAGGRRHECPAWPVGDGAHGERSTWFRTACAFVPGRSAYGEESSDS